MASFIVTNKKIYFAGECAGTGICGEDKTSKDMYENGIIERIISPKEVNTKEHGKQVAP